MSDKIDAINSIITDIRDERIQRSAKYDKYSHPIRRKEEVCIKALKDQRGEARMFVRRNKEDGTLTLYDILAKAFSEAFAADTIEDQRKGMIEIAVTAIRIVECLDRKKEGDKK